MGSRPGGSGACGLRRRGSAASPARRTRRWKGRWRAACASSSPIHGRRISVCALVIFCARASVTSCCGAPREMSVSLGVQQVLAHARVDACPAPVQVLRALAEVPARPGRALGRRLQRAAELREDRMRHVDVDAADRVDQVGNRRRSMIGHVVDRHAEPADRADGQRCAAVLVGGSSPCRTRGRGSDAQVARDREVRDRFRSGSVRTSMIESVRRKPRRAAVPSESVPSSSTCVGFESSEPSCGASAARARCPGACSPSRRRLETDR